ncbi:MULTISPECIES: Stf0 family sulfotransferase [unclassified Caballeronia]|uniref:Stf0 family sulfotransferase n=1 Tax=unclassified Caballeronia TaxID=2646786 RepID=UPI00202974CF|nr:MULTISPECIES: Stf0 family sulfotransferase [unclassified Caballeronia]
MINKVAEVFSRDAVIHDAMLRNLATETRLYAIFILPRTGSTWLMEMAENSKFLGTPQEWFNEGWIYTEELAMGCRPPRLVGTTSVDEYIRRTVADYRSASGVMGLQLSPYQTQCLCEMLEKPKDALDMVTKFYLRRENLIAQAISLFRSVTSGLFHSYQESPVLKSRLDAVEYDGTAIQTWCEHIVTGEIFYDELFTRMNISPARFTYEDVVAKPREILSWLAAHIDQNLKSGDIETQGGRMSKMGGKTSSEWEQRFRAEHAQFLVDLENRRPPVVSDFLVT